MLLYVFCEPDFDEILLLQTASRPEPQFQIVWKMQQKPIFPFEMANWNLYMHIADPTPLCSTGRYLDNLPWGGGPKNHSMSLTVGSKHEAVKTLSLPGTAGQSFKLGRGLCKMRASARQIFRNEPLQAQLHLYVGTVPYPDSPGFSQRTFGK